MSTAAPTNSDRADTGPNQCVVYCHRCGSCDPLRLYAPLRDGFACSSCWRELGQPFPRAAAAPELVHQAEILTRERMTARGGTDRHLVRSGKS